jgi:hypothetical protein
MNIHIYRLTKYSFYPRGEEEPEYGSIEEWWWLLAEVGGSEGGRQPQGHI